MASGTFLCCCIFFCIINLCNACKPFDRRNFFNAQSNANLINEILTPLKSVLPVYNNYTIPNYGKVIEQFQRGKANADVYLNFTQLVTKYGYPVEQHEVETEDGYLLTVYRISRPCSPTVITQHGLMSSSDDWITGGVGVSLAYALYEAGYDVWLGNFRGNKHSRKHVTMSPDCEEFWRFSQDPIMLYDLPAMIDYILEKTGQSKLSYIGHSEGTTVFYGMASWKPEYNDKISIMISLSAVVFMGHVRSPLLPLVAPFTDVLEGLAELIGLYEMNPRDELFNVITSTFCGSPKTAEIFCENLVFMGAGFNFPQLNITNLPVIYGHYPAGGSAEQVAQYGQSAKSGKFSMYNFGAIKNLVKYGTHEPPEYPLHKVSSPIAIFYSNNDWLTSAPDIYKLLKILPNMVEFYHVPCASFQHLDFLFAKDNNILVNKEVLILLKKYAENSFDACEEPCDGS